MILGRGLIATAFKNSVFDSPLYVVFASGVSNSMESDPKAFARELALLDSSIAKNTTILYFSTTSIFDPTKQDTPYIQHKLTIEKHIREKADSYIITRLPILVGHTPNPHTLINYMVEAIREKKKLDVHARACRHLLDIDDLVNILVPYAFNPHIKAVLNIPGSQKIMVPVLVSKIESLLHTVAEITFKDSGACYEIPDTEGTAIYIPREHYIDDILKKYIVS
jgi:dTDP-4-dehydrorhamnose reductase